MFTISDILCFTVFVSLKGVLTQVARSASCSASLVCWSDVESYMPLDGAAAVFPYYTDADLDVICSALHQAENCSAPLRNSCSKAELRLQAGVEKGAQFLCNEGKERYKRIRECLTLPKVSTECRKCNSTYRTALNSLHSGDSSLKVQQSKLCGYMDSFIECLASSVNKLCGKEASNWLVTLKDAIFLPIRDEINCTDGRRVSPAIVFGSVVGVIISILSVGLMCLVYRRHQIKNLPKTSRNSGKPHERRKNPKKKKKKKNLLSVNGSTANSSAPLMEFKSNALTEEDKTIETKDAGCSVDLTQSEANWEYDQEERVIEV